MTAGCSPEEAAAFGNLVASITIQQIGVTDAGLALLKQCRTRVKKLETRMIEGFSADEEQVIRRWLASLAREGEAG